MEGHKITKPLIKSLASLTKTQWEILKAIVDDLFKTQINNTKVDEKLINDDVDKYTFNLETGEVLKGQTTLKKQLD